MNILCMMHGYTVGSGSRKIFEKHRTSLLTNFYIMKKFLLMMLAVVFCMPALFANEVYFYFQDGEEDDFELEYPSAFVSIWDTTDEEMVSVPEDMAFMSYQFTGAKTLRISPSDFDYELVVEVQGDLDTYMLDKEETEWYLTLLPDADGLEIYVRVYLEGTAPGGGDTSNVSLNFNIQAADGSNIANPGDGVNISYFDMKAFQNVDVDINDDFASASVAPGTSVSIKPAEGYKITDVMTYLEGTVSISEPGEGDTEWIVAVDYSPASDFAALFVTVDKADGPGEEPDPNKATITQIEPLQWMISWDAYRFIGSLDTEYDGEYAILTDSNNKSITLKSNNHDQENPNIFFNDYSNFFTVNLEGLNLPNGTYQLTIPDKYVWMHTPGTEDGAISEAQYFDLVVGRTPTVTNTPRFTELNGNQFFISWENVTTLAEGTTKGAYMENIMTGEKYDMHFLEDYMYSKANLRIAYDYMLSVNLTNNYEDLPDGAYALYIPANYVKFNGTNRGNEAIEGYTFSYLKAWDDGAVNWNGPTSEGVITATWADATAIQLNKDYAGDGEKINGITVWDSTNKQFTIGSDNVSVSGNVLSININGYDFAKGECHLLVPQYYLFVTVDGVTDYNYDNSYYFGEKEGPVLPDVPQYDGEATWNIRSGASVNEGDLIEVGWSNYKLSFIEGADPVTVRSDLTGVLDLDYGTEVYLSEDNTRIIINLAGLPNALYTFMQVPEACVYIDVDGTTYFNTATSMQNINFSGIDGVVAEDGFYRVFNLQGILILETENLQDLNTLAKGIYIVNGKKIVR